MSKLDSFTAKRLTRFVENWRTQSGQLPTLKDLGEAGFSKAQIDLALKSKLIEEFYVSLTSGSIVKGYKVSITCL